jgi:peptidoglycan/LPS O-acetylase OafA/YrhL
MVDLYLSCPHFTAKKQISLRATLLIVPAGSVIWTSIVSVFCYLLLQPAFERGRRAEASASTGLGAMKRFAYIDALRGYAVLGVLLTHMGQEVSFTGNFIAVGARGVQLFFVVSAMTLLLSWRERADGAFPFFVRRAFRIAPMFWLSIPIYWQPSYDPYQIIGAAFFLQASRPEWLFAPIVPGGWSVCAEVAFYCLFPLIVATVSSLQRALLLVAASLVISRLWRTVGLALLPAVFPGASSDQLWSFAYFTFPAQLPAFAAGIAGYFLLPRFGRLSRRALELLLVLTFAGLVWFTAFHKDNFAAFAGLFAIAAACIANGAGRYLVHGLINHIGRCSFSIYLLQWIGIGWASRMAEAFPPELRLAVFFLGAIALSTALASVTYFAVERPMIRLGNYLLRRRLNNSHDVVADDRRLHVVVSGVPAGAVGSVKTVRAIDANASGRV